MGSGRPVLLRKLKPRRGIPSVPETGELLPATLQRLTEGHDVVRKFQADTVEIPNVENFKARIHLQTRRDDAIL